MPEHNVATLTPMVFSEIEPIELADGKRMLWKKEILPAGRRSYKGTTLDFAKINPACLSAFKEKAFDAVPFVLALPNNAHPKVGEEFDHLEGDLEDVELSADGRLFGYFDFSNSPRMQDLITKTKGKFGVSCRIEVDYRRDDIGKSYEYALSHVCGTSRPHIKGMNPWERVELSDNEGTQTMDFSVEPVGDAEDENGDTVQLQITQEQWQILMEFLAAFRDKSPDAPAKKEEPVTMTEFEKDLARFRAFQLDFAEHTASTAINLGESGDAPWFNIREQDIGSAPLQSFGNPNDPTGHDDIIRANEAAEYEAVEKFEEARRKDSRDPAYQAFINDIARDYTGPSPLA